jgi:hypothetical protein
MSNERHVAVLPDELHVRDVLLCTWMEKDTYTCAATLLEKKRCIGTIMWRVGTTTNEPGMFEQERDISEDLLRHWMSTTRVELETFYVPCDDDG